MFKPTRIFFPLLVLLLARPGWSAVNSVASLANPMDSAGASARAVGMGSAFVAVADDSSALFWNPAGLGSLPNIELALHHNAWLAGIVQETAVLGLPLGSLGGLAVSGSYVNYGSFPGYDDNGSRESDYNANRYGAAVGWGKTLGREISLGLALKGNLQTIDGTRYTDLSLDLGALWRPSSHWSLGVDYSSLGTRVASYDQASEFSFGSAYRLDFSKGNQLLLAASATLQPQGVNRLQVGVEDLISSILALRLGYQAPLAQTEIEGLSGMTAGVGLKVKGFSLDYAYQPFGDLGTTHRLSLGFEFGQSGSN